jgi:hypothetical protein
VIKKDKFKVDMTLLIERITNNLTEFDNEENGPKSKIDCCNDIIRVSKKIDSLANNQIVIESINKNKSK